MIECGVQFAEAVPCVDHRLERCRVDRTHQVFEGTAVPGPDAVDRDARV